MSWLVRQSLSRVGGGGHEHGLSAGPVYGYIPQFAQTSTEQASSVPFDPDYVEPVGFGAEGPDDGYDPYGIGDQGFGYGYGQF